MTLNMQKNATADIRQKRNGTYGVWSTHIKKTQDVYDANNLAQYNIDHSASSH